MKTLRIAFIIVSGLFLYSLALTSVTRVVFTYPDQGRHYFGPLPKLIIQMTDIGKNLKAYLNPEYLLKNSADSDGFTYQDKSALRPNYHLLVSYKLARYKGVFELYDLQNGDLVKSWQPDNESIYKQLYTDENPRGYPKGTDFNNLHPLLMADSSIVYNVEHSGLIMIDSKGMPIWVNNDKVYHHSLEMDDKGYIYVSTQPFQSRKFSFLPADYLHYRDALMDDEISVIDPKNGETVFCKSVIELLLENGYEELLESKGQFTSDPVHLNDIQPAITDSEYWQKGDLLVSARNLSIVFLYRSSTNKILWLKQGPWLNQHDVDFIDSTRISIFSNEVLRLESYKRANSIGGSMVFSNDRPHNEIYVYDFKKDTITTPYSTLMSSQDIRTATAGRSEILANGDIFIEETNSAKVIIGDSTKVKLSYVKRVDEDHITHLNWSRIVEKN